MNKTELADHLAKRIRQSESKIKHGLDSHKEWQAFHKGMIAAFTTAEAMVRGMHD
tara:strand:+ start:1217 stop:1381 length:165 start_codon:yes stop_codon:yes gene_type:complete